MLVVLRRNSWGLHTDSPTGSALPSFTLCYLCFSSQPRHLCMLTFFAPLQWTWGPSCSAVTLPQCSDHPITALNRVRQMHFCISISLLYNQGLYCSFLNSETLSTGHIIDIYLVSEWVRIVILRSSNLLTLTGSQNRSRFLCVCVKPKFVSI